MTIKQNKLTNTEAYSSLLSKKSINEALIKDLLLIDARLPDNITIRNSEIYNLNLSKEDGSIVFYNCIIHNMKVLENCKKIIFNSESCIHHFESNFAIEHLFFYNSTIDLLKYSPEEDPYTNSLLSFNGGTIDKLTLYGFVNRVSLRINGKINSIEINNAKTISISKHNSKELLQINKLGITSTSETTCGLQNIHIKELLIRSTDALVNFGSRSNQINSIVINGYFANKSKINFSHLLDVKRIFFSSCELPRLMISNSDLSKTLFSLYESFIDEFRWHNIKWSRNIESYRSLNHLVKNSSITIRFLKQKSIENSDNFNTAFFKCLEFASIWDELRLNSKSLKLPKTIKWFVSPFWDIKTLFQSNKDFQFGDKVSLYLNKYSNNHGLNWIRGVWFTLIISFFFFFLSLLTLQNKNFEWGYTTFFDFVSVIKSNLPYYGQFLYPAHSFDIFKKFDPGAFFIIWDWLGRIFVSYGFYQVIKAFRKFQ